MGYKECCPVYSCSQASLTTVNEVKSVIIALEPNKVTTKYSLQKNIFPRMNLDHVPGREGDVHEVPNLAGQVVLLGNPSHYVAHFHQVVVVDPDKGDVIRVLRATSLYLLQSYTIK